MAKLGGFTADPKLASMSQKASSLLKSRGQVQAGSQLVSRPAFQQSALPSSFLQGRVSQLLGAARTAASQVQALKINPYQAQSRDTIYAQAAARAASAQQMQEGRGGGGLELANTVKGYSDEAVRAAAARYAGPRTYQGGAYVPGKVQQEGTVTFKNGKPGVMIKYRTPGGDTTEWTPL